jgi:hypothetical protein
VNARFDMELRGEKPQAREELARYQLEFEMRVVIQPAFTELGKLGLKIDGIRRSITENISQITGIQF